MNLFKFKCQRCGGAAAAAACASNPANSNRDLRRPSGPRPAANPGLRFKVRVLVRVTGKSESEPESPWHTGVALALPVARAVTGRWPAGPGTGNLSHWQSAAGHRDDCHGPVTVRPLQRNIMTS